MFICAATGREGEPPFARGWRKMRAVAQMAHNLGADPLAAALDRAWAELQTYPVALLDRYDRYYRYVLWASAPDYDTSLMAKLYGTCNGVDAQVMKRLSFLLESGWTDLVNSAHASPPTVPSGDSPLAIENALAA